jgi:hypothetical protein
MLGKDLRWAVLQMWVLHSAPAGPLFPEWPILGPYPTHDSLHPVICKWVKPMLEQLMQTLKQQMLRFMITFTS